jgi:aminodeoxyfutalosine synthase
VEAVSTLDALAERVSRAGAIEEADARLILASHDLVAIGMMADEARRRRHGRRTTFVRVFELHCDAVPSSVPQGVTAGELRLVGHPASIEVAVSATRAAAALAAGRPLSGFSLADLQALAASGGKAMPDVCAALRDAGLELIAETPLDATFAAEAAVVAARRAGLQVLRLTINVLPRKERVAVVARARDLQEKIGGFKAFAPLPRTLAPDEPTTGYDDVKQIAIARLLVANIDSIQVDWPLYGPKLAQVALTMGADDVDGVAAYDPATLGTRRSALEEIRQNIRAASLEPVERDGRFGRMGGDGGDGGHG